MDVSVFVQIFVSVGASRVRDLFEKVKAPCIVFMGEIGAVKRHHVARMGHRNDETI